MELRIEAGKRGFRLLDIQYEALAKAVYDTIKEVTEGAKQDIRGQVTGSGMGNRLANTVRGKVYPERGISPEAAGIIYSKASYFDVFATGAVIRGKDGNYLAIPTPAAPKRGLGGKKITPSNFPEWSLGKLRFVYRPGGHGLLVVDNLRASTGKRAGKFRRASERALKTGTGLATVIMFVLVPVVKMKKTVDFDAVRARRGSMIAPLLLERWQREYEKQSQKVK